MKKILLLALILNISSNIVYSQKLNNNNNENIIENLVLFTDRDIYISGENVWFSSFSYINDMLSNKTLSNVLYVEVYNDKRKTIIKKKFKILNGIAYGKFKIPEETQSGNYFIRAYTQYLRNFSPEQYFTSFISIVNPEVTLNKVISKNNVTLLKDSLTENTNSTENNILGIHHNYKLSSEAVNIDIDIDKEKLSSREIVNFTINPFSDKKSKNSHLCVSVVKHGSMKNNDTIIPDYLINNPHLLNSYLLSSKNNHDLFSSSKIIPESLLKQIKTFEEIKNNSKYQDYEKFKWIAETRDVSISGVVRDKITKKPLSNHQIYVSVLGENPQFHINSTRKNGEFNFSLDKLQNIQGVLISMKQFKNYQADFLVNNDFSVNFASDKTIAFKIDSSQRKLFEEMFINYQISKLYHNTDFSDEINQPSSPISFGDINISITLDDFIDLPTFYDVINEIIPYTRIIKKKDRYSIIIKSSKTTEEFHDPLILLDNIPVFNINELAKINPKKIEKIEVIDKSYIYGDFIINGIIRIITNTNNFADYDFSKESVYVDFQTITPAENLELAVFNTSEKMNSRIPDFKNMLYWKPDVLLSNQKVKLSFYTSDDCSNYDIIVRGITNDGRACFGKASINVKN